MNGHDQEIDSCTLCKFKYVVKRKTTWGCILGNKGNMPLFNAYSDQRLWIYAFRLLKCFLFPRCTDGDNNINDFGIVIPLWILDEIINAHNIANLHQQQIRISR